MKKETIRFLLNTLSTIKISPMEPDAAEAFNAVNGAAIELKEELGKIELAELAKSQIAPPKEEEKTAEEISPE